jgi:hypothetical protein
MKLVFARQDLLVSVPNENGLPRRRPFSFWFFIGLGSETAPYRSHYSDQTCAQQSQRGWLWCRGGSDACLKRRNRSATIQDQSAGIRFFIHHSPLSEVTGCRGGRTDRSVLVPPGKVATAHVYQVETNYRSRVAVIRSQTALGYRSRHHTSVGEVKVNVPRPLMVTLVELSCTAEVAPQHGLDTRFDVSATAVIVMVEGPKEVPPNEPEPVPTNVKVIVSASTGAADSKAARAIPSIAFISFVPFRTRNAGLPSRSNPVGLFLTHPSVVAPPP